MSSSRDKELSIDNNSWSWFGWFRMCKRDPQNDDSVTIHGSSLQNGQSVQNRSPIPDDTKQYYIRKVQEQEQTNKGLSEMVKDMKSQISVLTTKLAQEMNTKMSANESAIENISIKNRPMNIADEYSALCSNTWLEAKNTLDNLCLTWTESDKLRLLCDILTVCESVCRNRLQKMFIQFSSIFMVEHCHDTTPQTETLVSIEQPSSSLAASQKLPQELLNVIGDMLRNNSDTIDLTDSTKIITDTLNAEYQHQTSTIGTTSIFTNSSMKQYIDASTRLAWKMAIQRPSMEFKLCNYIYDRNHHEVYWGSEDIQGANIIDVYPCLFQSHNLMAKGKVFIFNPKLSPVDLKTAL